MQTDLRIAFKPEVRFSHGNWRPAVTAILEAAVITAPRLFDDVLVVTSANDGKHSKEPLSAHYVGAAWDWRFEGMREGGIQPPDWSVEWAKRVLAHDAAAMQDLRDAQNFEAEEWAYRTRRYLATDDYVVIAEIDKIHIHGQYGRRIS